MAVLHRITLPLINSFLITAALFAFMYSLIYVDEPELSNRNVLPKIAFGYIPKDKPLDVIQPKPKPPELIDLPPEIPNISNPVDIDPFDGPGFADYKVDPPKGSVLAPSDQQLVIAIGYPPSYPNTALSRGIEGFAVVGFSVSAAGEVYDPYILESEPGTVFDRSAIKAISKFKYRARTVNGKPVSTDGQRYLFTYKLDQG